MGGSRDVQVADMLVHEAGRAVIACERGVRNAALRFSMKDWSRLMPFAGAALDHLVTRAVVKGPSVLGPSRAPSRTMISAARSRPRRMRA